MGSRTVAKSAGRLPVMVASAALLLVVPACSGVDDSEQTADQSSDVFVDAGDSRSDEVEPDRSELDALEVEVVGNGSIADSEADDTASDSGSESDSSGGGGSDQETVADGESRAGADGRPGPTDSSASPAIDPAPTGSSQPAPTGSARSTGQGEAGTAGDAAQPSVVGLQLVQADMDQPHEARPAGVRPDSGWGEQPRVGYGNNPPAGWTAAIPWGQVYTDDVGDSTVNTRFQIRDIELWYLSKSDGVWRNWSKTSNIEGANYAEDFQNNVSVDPDIRSEAGNGGGISATLIPGYNFHFWDGDGRVTIDPTDIAGVWASLESRLILDDPNGADDRGQARMMMGAGADYWQDTSIGWDQWTTNGDIFIGRFRYLTAEWQTFHAHSLTPEQLRANPPPIG